MASWSRDLTVPTGIPRRSATWRWLCPSRCVSVTRRRAGVGSCIRSVCKSAALARALIVSATSSKGTGRFLMPGPVVPVAGGLGRPDPVDRAATGDGVHPGQHRTLTGRVPVGGEP